MKTQQEYSMGKQNNKNLVVERQIKGQSRDWKKQPNIYHGGSVKSYPRKEKLGSQI